MAETQLPHGRDDVPAAPHAHTDAEAPRAADPADRGAFRKALAHWPLLAEMDRYLAWDRRGPSTRDDDPDTQR